jgi:hypothetical protein
MMRVEEPPILRRRGVPARCRAFAVLLWTVLFLTPSQVKNTTDGAFQDPPFYRGPVPNKVSTDTALSPEAGVTPEQTPEEYQDRFHPIIIEAASAHEVDPVLIKAVIMAESGYNPRAVSKKGAMGLMQLMPETAADLGVEDVFDPEQNIHGGVKYLKQLMTRFDGSVRLALAAYNAGTSKVRKYRGVPPYKATRFYIEKVLNLYRLYQGQASRGLDRA